MLDWFTDLEILVLLVACLCHDLDHRGTNNSFQAKYVFFFLHFAAFNLLVAREFVYNNCVGKLTEANKTMS